MGADACLPPFKKGVDAERRGDLLLTLIPMQIPLNPPLQKGEEKKSPTEATSPSPSGKNAEKRACFDVASGAPVRPPRNGDHAGEVGEDCLRPRRGRVPQPPAWSSTAGQPEGPVHRGRLFFGHFLLAKQKKVTSCRATPGDLKFVVSRSPFDKLRANGFARPLSYRIDGFHTKNVQ